MINHEIMKKSNRNRILNLIYQKKTITRQEISNVLNISFPTVVTNVSDMVNEGILAEAGVASSTGGRKPIIVTLVANSKYSIGVEIRPFSSKLILMNLESNIIDSRTITWDVFNIDSSMLDISLLINQMLLDNKINKEKLLGIGFALPGIVDEENYSLENAPNLGIHDIDFAKFQNLFPAEIYIENEANAAAYAEAMYSLEDDNPNLIFLSINEGIGTGIMIHNQLYKGHNKKAGEFGHIRITSESIKCACGRYGCWEIFASEKGLKSMFYKHFNQALTIEEIFVKVEESKDAQELLNQYIDSLVIGLENIILAFSPDTIIIGGLISNYSNIILPLIYDKLGSQKTIYEIGKTRVVCSKLGNNAAIYGAALLPLHNLFYYEKIVI